MIVSDRPRSINPVLDFGEMTPWDVLPVSRGRGTDTPTQRAQKSIKDSRVNSMENLLVKKRPDS